MDTPVSQEVPEGGLPFDLRTLLLGVLRRWPIVAACGLIFLVLGVGGALILGSRLYEAETVLLYKPTVVGTPQEGDYVPPPLPTQLNLVKIQSNLEEVRRRLELPTTLRTLGGACEVVVQPKTELMIIRAEWDSAETAAALANTLRDVFLENQRRIRQSAARRQISDLERRLEAVHRELNVADAALKAFTTKNNVVDLQQETQWYLDELTSIDVLYEQARIEKRTNDLQTTNLNKIISDLKEQVAKEQAASAQMEAISDTNIRIQRLREAIEDDKEFRARAAELAQKELELETAKKLRAQGLISEVKFGEVVAAYEKQKALTLDTEQIKQWRGEIARLDQAVIPTQGLMTPSGHILQDMLLRSFNLKLEQVSLAEKVKHLEEARARLKAKLNSLPALQREYVALSREVSAREAEKQGIEDLLAKVRRIHDSQATDFTIIADAKVPTLPTKSNRKLIFLAIAALGPFLGLMIALALELMDTTIKSGKELALKLSLPVLGVLPRLPTGSRLIPGQGESALVESFRLIARRLRSAVPKPGARILIVSARQGEGKTTLAANLAACWGRQDERVLLLDAHVRVEENGQAGVNDQPWRNGQPPSSALLQSLLIEPLEKIATRLSRSFPKRLARAVPRLARPVEQLPLLVERLAAWLKQRVEQQWLQRTGAAGAPHTVDEMILNGRASLRGLGEYLSSEVDQVEEVIWPTRLVGVHCLPRITAPRLPDVLGTNRMRRLLMEVSERFSLILVDGPPVLPYVDAELLAEQCDAAVFVVRSQTYPASTLRKALDRLKAAGVPIVGAVLNGVDPLYLEDEG